MRLLTSSFAALPFCTGLMVLHAPAEPAELAYYLTNLLFIGMLFLAISRLLKLIIASHRGKRAAPGAEKIVKWRRLKYYAYLLTLVFVVLASLQILRVNTAPFVFYPIVALIALKGLEQKFMVDRRYWAGFIVMLIYYTGVGYVNFNLVAPTWILPALLFSLAMACMVTAVFVADHLENLPVSEVVKAPEKSEQGLVSLLPSNRGYRIFCSSLIVAGPSLIGLLAYVRVLPQTFSLVLVLVLPAARMISAMKPKERFLQIPPLFAQQTAGLCLLFAGVILLLGIVSGT